jgi:hypothetical protein
VTRSALDCDLARLQAGAPGRWPFSVRARSAGVTAVNRLRAVSGVTLGRQPAVCRRCKGGAASRVAVRVPRAHRARPVGHGPPVITSTLRVLLRAEHRASWRTARSARP